MSVEYPKLPPTSSFFTATSPSEPDFSGILTQSVPSQENAVNVAAEDPAAEDPAASVTSSLNLIIPKAVKVIRKAWDKTGVQPTEISLSLALFKNWVEGELDKNLAIAKYATDQARRDAVKKEFEKQFLGFRQTVFSELIVTKFPSLKSVPNPVRAGVFGIAELLVKGWLHNLAVTGEKLERSTLDTDQFRQELLGDVLDYLIQHDYLESKEDPRCSFLSKDVQDHYTDIATFWFECAREKKGQHVRDNDEDDGSGNKKANQNIEQRELARLKAAFDNRGTHYDILGLERADLDEETDEEDYLAQVENAYRGLTYIHPDKVEGRKDLELQRDEADKLFRAINDAKDTLKDPKKRIKYKKDSYPEVPPKHIQSIYKQLDPTVRGILFSADMDKVERQYKPELEKANKNIRTWVELHTSYPLDTYRLPWEVLLDIKQKGNNLEAVRRAFQRSRGKYPWFLKWEDLYRGAPPKEDAPQKPLPKMPQEKPSQMERGASKSSPVAEVVYDPAWTEKADPTSTRQPGEEPHPYKYYYQEWDKAPSDGDVIMENGSDDIEPGFTRAGHRIVGHIPKRQKLVDGVGNADCRYFIDVGPKDARGDRRNPLRVADHGEMDPEVARKYLENASTEFVMQYNEFFYWTAAMFKRILGMTFVEDDTQSTYLWVVGPKGEEIVTKSMFKVWMRKSYKSRIKRFLKWHHLQPPYDIFRPRTQQYSLTRSRRDSGRHYEEYDSSEDSSDEDISDEDSGDGIEWIDTPRRLRRPAKMVDQNKRSANSLQRPREQRHRSVIEKAVRSIRGEMGDLRDLMLDMNTRLKALEVV